MTDLAVAQAIVEKMVWINWTLLEDKPSPQSHAYIRLHAMLSISAGIVDDVLHLGHRDAVLSYVREAVKTAAAGIDADDVDRQWALDISGQVVNRLGVERDRRLADMRAPLPRIPLAGR